MVKRFQILLDKAKEKEVWGTWWGLKRNEDWKKNAGCLRRKKRLSTLFCQQLALDTSLYMRKPRESSLSHVIAIRLQCCFYPHACWGWLVLQTRAWVPHSSQTHGAQTDPQSEYHHLNRPCLFLFFQESLLQPLRKRFQSQHRWGGIQLVTSLI